MTSRSAMWYCHRLRAMRPAEVLHRIRERVRHLADASWLKSLQGLKLSPATCDCPLIPDQRHAPEALKQVLASDAEALTQGDWMLFGWRRVSVGSPPCWHRDPTCGVIIQPGIPAHKLNHRALPDGADARSIWEINRWAEMVRLAMHGYVNDDGDAIETAQRWLSDWVERNVAGKGINWTSPLEAALRLINFCWFDALAAKVTDIDGKIAQRQRELVGAIVPVHCGWVHRYQSVGSSANNHRLGELTGLLLAVKRWPELEGIAGRAETLWRGVEECVLAQFADDGGNREQALHYHLFAFEMAFHACHAMNIKEGAAVERLHRAAEFFFRMSHSKEPWDYGDNDDAQIVPLTLQRERATAEWCAYFRGPSSTLAASEAELMDATAGNAIAYWLGNVPISVPRSAASKEGHWWLAEESGMGVIEREGWKVRVDASPLGFGRLAAHGHCDALHASIWDGEHALIIDPGTGGYYAANEFRSELAAWNAHNGPQPTEGFRTPERMGTFLWSKAHARPHLKTEGQRLLCELDHESHRLRRSVEVHDGTITVSDQHLGGEPIFITWMLAPECDVDAVGNGSQPSAISISRNGSQWKLDFSQGNGRSPRIVRTLIPVSRHFGSKCDSWGLEVTSQTGQLTTTFRRL